ncbi:RNA-binding domain-containing protein [Phanerochaete sordida]|uniref:RNA-binding domain-containing protein n=1 Tax=Phanerochaete sordida TaxID=48140 RepID=A0A9P3GMN7_9APHY|nr:RNA-binding domain-containing protein [Phanerochaete sordida]
MSNALGKRKEREAEGQDGEQKVHGATLFVSNLPYSATTTDLKTLFSDIGPVRTAFVVLEQGTGTSKGVGYVTFAIREDAQLAFDKVNEPEGLILDGRKLRAQWAENKPHRDERQAGESPVKKESKPAKVPRAKEPSGPRDPNAIRTIVITGLPQGIDSKVLWKKVRKYTGAEKVEYPAKIDDEEDASTAHVLFSTPAAAQEAVSKLHAHVFKGALLSVTLKKRLEGLAKAPKKVATKDPSSSKAPAKVPAPSRASRLIVRNLPFDITEPDLRAVFLPYGPIYSIHIPLADAAPKDEESGEPSRPRSKGYAFVWYLSKKDAEKALEGANGSKVYAGMADGLVRDKQKKKKLRREEAKIKQKEKERKAKQKGKDAEGDEEPEDEEESEEEEEKHGAERVIAVDWALSKDKWEEVKAKLEEENAEEAADESDDEQNKDEESGGSDEEEEDSHIGLHEDSGDESGSQPSEDDSDDSMSVDEEDEKPGRPQLPPPEVGTTIFVRNVPFEATEDELRTVFRAFGPLRYAKVAIDHETGRSRGTGFVCFWNKEHADKAIEQSEILRKETMGPETQAAQPKKNPFKLPSLLTPDPSASIAQNLVLHGRTMDVIRAVTREEAGKLKEAGERQREKADKRNLYLLREGIIMPNSPAAEGVPSAEIEKRTTSFNARRALLRSNPSLYVSRTRLSIRQLPLFVTERMLKRLGFHAVRAFEAEVKAGKRSALTEDELTEPAPDAEDAEAPPAKDKGKGKAADKKGRSTGVKQAKIVRQQGRVDPVTGKGRSRGYGFLEMSKHADALRVLRWANNNLEVGKLFEEWWKEELGDLIKIEKKKETKEEGRLERMKAELAEGAAKRARGTLIVEFSIENVQVVKRRVAHQQEAQTTPSEPRKKERRLSLPKVKKEEDEKDQPKRKKPRVSDPANVKTENSDKAGGKIGSLIGRKRKERKAKRKP